MRSRGAEPAFGIGAVDRMADLGEEDRVRHRRVVEFLGVVVFLHAEGAEAAVRRLVRRKTGRDRPVVSLGAVDCDGHHLRILVDGDGDVGLRGAGGAQYEACERNEEGAHFSSSLQVDHSAVTAAPLSPSPGIYYAPNVD